MIKSKILGLVALGSILYGDMEISDLHNKNQFGLTGFAVSNHKADGFNEEHKWIGVNYEFYEKNKLHLSTEYAYFTNSYNNKTHFLTVNGTKYFLNAGDLQAGVSLGIGIQKGYCLRNYETVSCKNSMNDVSLLVLPSISIKYDRVSMEITPTPDVIVGRFKIMF